MSKAEPKKVEVKPKDGAKPQKEVKPQPKKQKPMSNLDRARAEALSNHRKDQE